MYAMPETAIGFFTDVGGSYFLSRMKNEIELGLYIGLTGARVKNRDLVKWGIATHYVPADKIDELYKAITNSVSKTSTDAEIDEIVDYFADKTAGQEAIENYEEIKAIFKPDSAKAILDRLAASKSEFAAKTLKMLGNMSPLSLCVVFEQIIRGSKMDVKEVFEMEYGISQGYMNHTEFFEGVRAKLVDKTNEPNWKFKSVDDVPRSEVEYFFN
jgi:enoyl-CoA hydratase/carnithine racemase